jgi:uncharacterized protein (DUF1778 family)
VTSARPPSAQPASPPATRPSRRQAGKGSGPAKTSRIELRATEDDRDLLDRAAAALGTDRSSFLLAQGRLAAQRVLADREHFPLDAAAQQEWERINSRPARSLPGLVRLLERPSPFGSGAFGTPPAAADRE